jgi:hypothetical protein
MKKFHPCTTESIEINGFNENFKLFSKEETLKTLEDHEDHCSLQCIFDNCREVVSSKSEIEDHYEKHIKVRLYKCDYEGCEKVYRSKENMTLHFKNVHLKLKPYKCRFCTSTFSHRNGNYFIT